MKKAVSLTENNNENALPVKYNPNYSVIQANELIRSKQDELSLLEAKFIKLVIAQVLKEDTDLQTYTCTASDLAEFLGVSKQAIYNETKRDEEDNISKFTKKLLKKTITVRNRETGGYSAFQWVTTVDYDKGVFTVKLHERLKPYIIGLNELFTSYKYEEILKLSTSYSIRMYELLLSYANIQFRETQKLYYGNIELEQNEAIFPMEYLREYFNCEKKYPNNADFIKRVIASSIQDINLNTVFPCSYRLIKEGKKIVYVIFKLGDWKSPAGQMILDNFLEAARNQGKAK